MRRMGRLKRPRTTIYRPKSLVTGAEIHQPDGLYVAVPDKFADRQITVLCSQGEMVIHNWKKEAIMFRSFRDKFWREDSHRPQYYTLGYFKWSPIV